MYVYIYMCIYIYWSFRILYLIAVLYGNFIYMHGIFYLHLVDFMVSEACMFFSVYLPTFGHPSVDKKVLNFMCGVPSNNIPRKHPPARILVGL